MTKVTDEMVTKAVHCGHIWRYHSPTRRVCQVCDVGERVPEDRLADPTCAHRWVTGPWETFCRYCGIERSVLQARMRVQKEAMEDGIYNLSPVVDSMALEDKCIKRPPPLEPDAKMANDLYLIADRFEELKLENDELKAGIRESLGTRDCICGMCIGDPRVSDHSLQCRVLRGLVGIKS